MKLDNINGRFKYRYADMKKLGYLLKLHRLKIMKRRHDGNGDSAFEERVLIYIWEEVVQCVKESVW